MTLLFRFPLALIRFVFFIVSTLTAAVSGLVVKLLVKKHKAVFAVYNTWKASMSLLLNVRIEEKGKRPDRPGIIMSNHRSYIDIAITPAYVPFVIVAKKQVQSWPIVGWGGNAMSTIWVDRDSTDSRRNTRKQMKNRLDNGGSVLIYPEGTTYEGPGVLNLKPGMFHTCAEGGFTIYPMVIEYEDPAFSWVGDDLFIPHFIRHFGKWAVRAKVQYGPPLSGQDGEYLRVKCKAWMEEATSKLRAEFDAEKC